MFCHGPAAFHNLNDTDQHSPAGDPRHETSNTSALEQDRRTTAAEPKDQHLSCISQGKGAKRRNRTCALRIPKHKSRAASDNTTGMHRTDPAGDPRQELGTNNVPTRGPQIAADRPKDQHLRGIDRRQEHTRKCEADAPKNGPERKGPQTSDHTIHRDRPSPTSDLSQVIGNTSAPKHDPKHTADKPKEKHLKGIFQSQAEGRRNRACARKTASKHKDLKAHKHSTDPHQFSPAGDPRHKPKYQHLSGVNQRKRKGRRNRPSTWIHTANTDPAASDRTIDTDHTPDACGPLSKLEPLGRQANPKNTHVHHATFYLVHLTIIVDRCGCMCRLANLACAHPLGPNV